MTSTLRVSFVTALFVLAGCPGTSEPGDAGSDAPTVDSPMGEDTNLALDAPTDVPAPIDAPPGDDAGSDAPETADAGTDDDGGGAPDAGMCEYTGLDEVLVACDGEFTFVRRIGVFPETPECPEYYAVDGSDVHYASTDEAIAGESCEGECRWRYATAISRMRCPPARDGYEILRDTGCPDLYLFPEGFYMSVEAHDAKFPCPE